jgi:hypothetical protein
VFRVLLLLLLSVASAAAADRKPLIDRDGNPVVDCGAPITAHTCVVVDHPANRKYLKRPRRQ